LICLGFQNVTEISLQALLADIDRLVPEKWRATVRNNGLWGIFSLLGSFHSGGLMATSGSGGGFVNHNFFWKIMSPASAAGGSGGPFEGSLLASLITREFGGLEEFKDAFNKASLSRFGSGWAWVYCQDDRLVISSTANQDLLGVGTGKIHEPVLGLDVWEVRQFFFSGKYLWRWCH